MKVLKGKLRGDKEWTILDYPDAQLALGAMLQKMHKHGFKIKIVGNERHIINPITTNLEAIYVVEEDLNERV